MIQRSQHLRFALKSREPARIARECFRQHFDRDVAPELSVMRLIHLAHAARANRRDDFICSKPLAGFQFHEGMDYTSPKRKRSQVPMLASAAFAATPRLI